MHTSRDLAAHRRATEIKRLAERDPSLITVDIPGMDVNTPVISSLLDPLVHIGPPDDDTDPASSTSTSPPITTTTTSADSAPTSSSQLSTPATSSSDSSGESSSRNINAGINGPSSNTDSSRNGSGSGSSNVSTDTTQSTYVSSISSSPSHSSSIGESSETTTSTSGSPSSGAGTDSGTRTGTIVASSALSSGTISSSIEVSQANLAAENFASSVFSGTISMNNAGIVVTTIFSDGIPIATSTITGETAGSVQSTGSTGSETSTNTPTTTDSGATSTGGEENGQGKQLSAGIIALIVILSSAAAIFIIVFFLRRRHIRRRADRRQYWWARNGGSPEWVDIPSSNPRGEGTSARTGTMSQRSSFATTFDHSFDGEHEHLGGVVPPLPPLAEMRDIHSTGLVMHERPSPPLLINVDDIATDFDPISPRTSAHSDRSISSDPYTHYLVVQSPPGQDSGRSTPMSVRPFTPSESFSFPKPPTVSSTAHSRPTSYASAYSSFIRPPSPSLQFFSSGSNPNPFIDPMSKPEFHDIEVICRPFVHALEDEISVHEGDRVRVSKIFDDGWALVEKIPLEGSGKGKEKLIEGLIPIDCFRAADQEFSDFLASKRVGIMH